MSEPLNPITLGFIDAHIIDISCIAMLLPKVFLQMVCVFQSNYKCGAHHAFYRLIVRFAVDLTK